MPNPTYDPATGTPVTVTNVNTNGQALKAASAPVVIASDQWSPTAPAITEGNLANWLRSGNGFSCSTGKVTAAVNQAASWFSAITSAKNKLVYSIRVTYTSATQTIQFTYLTTDDAVIIGAGTVSDIANALNRKGGGAAPEAATAMHHNSAVAATTGTMIDIGAQPTNNAFDLVAPGDFWLIPAGVAGGFGVYQATTAAGSWAVTVKWVEF